MKYFLLMFLSVPLAMAGDVSPEDKFLVLPTDESVNADTFKNDQVKVLPAHKSENYKTMLPSVDERDEVFELAGLTKDIRKWDDFEKDSLYLSLSRPGGSTIQRLLLKYPKLSISALKSAQKMIAEKN